MEHNHCKCEHKNLKYCPHCDVVYCEDCKLEWKKESLTWAYWNSNPINNGTTITLTDYDVRI